MAVSGGDKMDFSNGTGWLAFGFGVLGALFGYGVRSGQFTSRVTTLERDLAELKSEVAALKTGQMTTATALATVSAQIESIGLTLNRMENKLDNKVDKP